RVAERAGAIHLGIAVGRLGRIRGELGQARGERRVHREHPLVQRLPGGARLALLTAHPVQPPVQVDHGLRPRRRVQAVDVLGDHGGRLEDSRAQRREQPVRSSGTGPAELLPADGRARPVAAPREVMAHELLVGHGGARHRVAAAVVRQPGSGGDPGTGEHRDRSAPQQVERGGDLLRGAATAVVRPLHRPPGRQPRTAAGGPGAVRGAGGGGEPAADVRRRPGATGRCGTGRAGVHPSRVGGRGSMAGQCSGCIPSSTVRISSATSAGSRLPNRDSSPRRASSSPKPTPEAGVTSGGRTTSDCISRAKSSETISSSSSTVSISSCSSGNEVTPRSILRTFAASGSRSRKSTSVAASSGAAVLLASDQYIEALLTIGGSPLVRAGSRSSCSGEPEDAWKVCTWVWNWRWKAARLLPKRPCSTPAAKSSICSDGPAVAPESTRERAYSRLRSEEH